MTQISPVRPLVISSLYPNSRHPQHGIFVENRLKDLCRRFPVQPTVIAPVPWFPFKGKIGGRYSEYAHIPFFEDRCSIPVWYPRYPAIPKIGPYLNHTLMAQALLRQIRKLSALGQRFDLIDAHYLYPDGVAAALVAGRLRLPYFLTARGSDVTEIALKAPFKRRILEAVAGAEKTICVSNNLARELIELGADPTRTVVLRNGVDIGRFTGKGRRETRKKLGVTGKILLFVGGLVKRKRVDLILDSLDLLRREAKETDAPISLLIAGGGPLREALQQQSESLGLGERVSFLGFVDPGQIPMLMAASDCLILPSEREGWANVLLEALASGTPVVSSNAGAAPDFLAKLPFATLVSEQTARSYANAIKKTIITRHDREAIMECAGHFDWTETSENIWQLFNGALRVRN